MSHIPSLARSYSRERALSVRERAESCNSNINVEMKENEPIGKIGTGLTSPVPTPILIKKGEEVYATDLSSMMPPILLHCVLSYTQSCFAEICYQIVGDVSTVLMMQAGSSIILCQILGRVKWSKKYYPTDFRLPAKYLKMLIIPNFAFAFQLLFKQIAIQWAGVGFGEIISGFSVIMAAWLQYLILNIKLDSPSGLLALVFYFASLVAAYFKVGWQGICIGLVQGSCSSIRTIYTRKVNNMIVIKPGHHQFFTGCTNFFVMGCVSVFMHNHKTFFDPITGEQFLPITRVFWPVSCGQFVAAFSDNVLVFYLMSLMAPLSYHLQSQVESLLTTSLDFIGITEMCGGRHKSFDTPTATAYFCRLTGVCLYTYSKIKSHQEKQLMLANPDASSMEVNEIDYAMEVSDAASLCAEPAHGIYKSFHQQMGLVTDHLSPLARDRTSSILSNPRIFDSRRSTMGAEDARALNKQFLPAASTVRRATSSCLSTPLVYDPSRRGSGGRPWSAFVHPDYTPGMDEEEEQRCRSVSTLE